jgi:hypothetical protein
MVLCQEKKEAKNVFILNHSKKLNFADESDKRLVIKKTAAPSGGWVIMATKFFSNQLPSDSAASPRSRKMT